MSPWEILEIPQTTERKKIKRAYAKKLKQINIDQQPEEFQQLKEAFDFAIKWTEEPSEVEAAQLFNEKTQRDAFMPQQEEQTALSFDEKMAQFLVSERYHYDLKEWQLLLKEGAVWSIDEYMRYSYQFQSWLVSYYQVVSREIIHFIFDVFSLKELEDTVGYSGYISEEFLALRKEMYTVPPFSFTVAKQVDEKNRDHYFVLRYSVYNYLKNNYTDRLAIETMIAQAKDITTKDLDLENLEMLNFIRMYGGKLTSGYVKQSLTEFLAKPANSEKNRTYELLSTYFEMTIEEGVSKVPKIFTNCPESELTIPHYLYNLITGNVYFMVKRYDLAYLFWRNLPLPQQKLLVPQFEIIVSNLPRETKKEAWDKLALMKKLEREASKKEKVEQKTAITDLKLFIYVCLLIAVLTAFIAILLYSTNDLTGHRINKELQAEVTVEQSSTTTETNDYDAFQSTTIQENPIAKDFITSIYLSSSVEERRNYTETLDASLLENEMLVNKLIEYDPSSKFTGATLADFTLRKNSTNMIVYYKGEPLSIITFLSDYLYNVVGEAGYLSNEYLMLNTTFDDLDLPLTTYAEKFVYTMYVSDNELLRYIFKRRYENSDTFTKQLQTFKKDSRFNNCSMADFEFIKTTNSEYMEDTAIYFKGERLLRIKNYSHGSLASIIGDQWHSISEYSSEPFTIYAPEESVRIFLKQILFSTDKEQHVTSYNEYFSEAMRQTIEKNLQLPMKKNDHYAGLFKTPDFTKEKKLEEFQIVLEDQEESLLFTFTNEGKLDHVYGKDWESINENPQKLSQAGNFMSMGDVDYFINE